MSNEFLIKKFKKIFHHIVHYYLVYPDFTASFVYYHLSTLLCILHSDLYSLLRCLFNQSAAYQVSPYTLLDQSSDD